MRGEKIIILAGALEPRVWLQQRLRVTGLFGFLDRVAVRVRAGCGRRVSVCGERAPRDGINDGPREDVMVGGKGRKEEK